MQRKRLVCSECGYEGTIEILSPEERDRVRGYPIVCPKCGSGNVRLHD